MSRLGARRRDGSWVDRRRTVHTLNGNRDARISAIRSLQGSRNEAFAVGLIHKPVVEQDVVSTYPAATLLQPLPAARTNWVKVESLDDSPSWRAPGAQGADLAPGHPAQLASLCVIHGGSEF